MIIVTTTGDSGLIKLLCVRMQLLKFPSLYACIYSVPCARYVFVFFFRFRIFSLLCVCVDVIVCFTLDINCEERRRRSNIRRVHNREEEELTRDKRGKERTINLKERKYHLSFSLSSSSSSSSSAHYGHDCMLYR